MSKKQKLELTWIGKDEEEMIERLLKMETTTEPASWRLTV